MKNNYFLNPQLKIAQILFKVEKLLIFNFSIFLYFYKLRHNMLMGSTRGLLVRAECVRCPWLQAETYVAIVLGGIFSFSPSPGSLLILTEGIVVWFPK